jgi:hypothetical protein
MKIKFSRQSFEKYSNIKFHEHLPSGSRVVSCGQTDRQAHMTEIKVAFRNLANATKITTLTADHVAPVDIEVTSPAVAYVLAGDYNAYRGV